MATVPATGGRREARRRRIVERGAERLAITTGLIQPLPPDPDSSLSPACPPGQTPADVTQHENVTYNSLLPDGNSSREPNQRLIFDDTKEPVLENSDKSKTILSRPVSSLGVEEEKSQISDELSQISVPMQVPAQIEWSWTREGYQRVKAKINLYSRRKILVEISDVLKSMGDDVYEEFRGSCFGHFLELDSSGVSCNAALHGVLSHEVRRPDGGDYELWFRVGGRLLRFSRYEYVLVTGLSFRPTTFDPTVEHTPPEAGLFRRVYRGRRVKMDQLRLDFIEGKFQGSPTDAVKVAKLLMAVFFLFAHDGRATHIDDWLWTLIEDTDRWESFSWGKYTFEILLYYLRHLRLEMATYHLYGFCWAFLVWAYEAIPSLGSTCGRRRQSAFLPRMLRWSFPRGARAIDFSGFFDGPLEVHPTLEPSIEEQQQRYWEHIDDDMTAGVHYVRRENPFKRKAPNVDSVQGRTRQRTVPQDKSRAHVSSSRMRPPSFCTADEHPSRWPSPPSSPMIAPPDEEPMHETRPPALIITDERSSRRPSPPSSPVVATWDERPVHDTGLPSSHTTDERLSHGPSPLSSPSSPIIAPRDGRPVHEMRLPSPAIGTIDVRQMSDESLREIIRSVVHDELAVVVSAIKSHEAVVVSAIKSHEAAVVSAIQSYEAAIVSAVQSQQPAVASALQSQAATGHIFSSLVADISRIFLVPHMTPQTPTPRPHTPAPQTATPVLHTPAPHTATPGAPGPAQQ